MKVWMVVCACGCKAPVKISVDGAAFSDAYPVFGDHEQAQAGADQFTDFMKAEGHDVTVYPAEVEISIPSARN